MLDGVEKRLKDDVMMYWILPMAVEIGVKRHLSLQNIFGLVI